MAKQTVTAHFSQTQEAFLDPKGQKSRRSGPEARHSTVCPPKAKYFHSMYLIPNHFVSSLSRTYLIILMYFCFQKSRTYFAL